MEQEEFTSKFKPLAKEEIVLVKDAFSVSGQSTKYLPLSKGDKFVSDLLLRVYEQLKPRKGTSEFFYSNKEERIFAPFNNVLDLLKKEEVIGRVRRMESRYNDAPAFFRFSVNPAYPAGMTDGRTTGLSGGYGFGKDAALVYSKSIGEFLERYFLSIYLKKDLIIGSCRSLQKKGYAVIQPNALAGFSETQKNSDPSFEWNQDSVFLWVKVKRISNNKEALSPAQCVFWNYLSGAKEPILREPNTNGGGGMFSPEGALLSGIYELIQRDAFLIYWLNNIAPTKINPATVPDDTFQLIFKESLHYGFKIHCLNTTADTGAPSFAAIVEDPAGWPRFSLGGGCEANPAKALCRALEEAWSVYYSMRKESAYSLPQPYLPFNDKSVNRSARLRLWANPEMRDKYAFFISGEEKNFSEINFSFPAQFPSEKEELRYLVKQVEELGEGYEVYCYFAKHRALSRLNYHAAKVIVPQMIPLYLNETMAPLAAARLKEVPKKLGYQPAEKLNPWPHPFP